MSSPLLSLDFAATLMTVCYLGHLTFGALLSSVSFGSQGESPAPNKTRESHSLGKKVSLATNSMLIDWARKGGGLFAHRSFEKRSLVAQRVARK